MAFIDYGALLKVNGKFINKNDDLFMETSDTGYMCEDASYFDESENKEEIIHINGDFYAYAGDEKFFLCFYKSYFYVISNNKIMHTVSWNPFLSETFYLEGYPAIKVERLSRIPHYLFTDPIDEYDKRYFLRRYGKKQGQKRIYRICKRIRRMKYRTKCLSGRWIASWDYKDKHYEVIYGYGIDPYEKTWNRIKHDKGYDFDDEEIKIIDEWFDGK